jgi:hypothetical protein
MPIERLQNSVTPSNFESQRYERRAAQRASGLGAAPPVVGLGATGLGNLVIGALAGAFGVRRAR